MVDERALEHLVDLAQVVLVGHPGAAYAGPAGRPRRRASQWSGDSTRLGLVGRDRPAHLPPGAHPLEAGSGQPARLALVALRRRRCRSAGSPDRGPRRRPAPGLGPLDQQLGARSATSSGRSRSTTCTKSIRPTGRSWTLPQAWIRRPRRGRRRSRASAGRARRPRRARRRRRRPPSRGRAARGRGAGGSAARRRSGRPGRACRPSSPRQPGDGAQGCVGIALEPVLVGDHSRPSCPARDAAERRDPAT